MDRRAAKSEALTGLLIEIFRVNGALLAAGDDLVGDLGLTSARWQVLGAIALSPVPLPVAHIARNMGLSRQAVQRIANEMERDGLLAFEDNPHHARAKLMVLTKAGAAAYATAMGRQRPWCDDLATDLSIQDIATAADVLRRLLVRLRAARPGLES